MNRRQFSALLLGATAVPAFGVAEGQFEVTRTDAEWRAMLTDTKYRVMREEGTERAFTSPLDKNYAVGSYICLGCQLPLYLSEAKYDSGTGWPSFY